MECKSNCRKKVITFSPNSPLKTGTDVCTMVSMFLIDRGLLLSDTPSFILSWMETQVFSPRSTVPVVRLFLSNASLTLRATCESSSCCVTLKVFSLAGVLLPISGDGGCLPNSLSNISFCLCPSFSSSSLWYSLSASCRYSLFLSSSLLVLICCCLLLRCSMLHG